MKCANLAMAITMMMARVRRIHRVLRKGSGKAREQRRPRGKGRGNGKGKGIVKRLSGGDDISCAVALQLLKEMSEAKLDKND